MKEWVTVPIDTDTGKSSNNILKSQLIKLLTQGILLQIKKIVYKNLHTIRFWNLKNQR